MVDQLDDGRPSRMPPRPPLPRPDDPPNAVQVLRIAARLLQRHQRDAAAKECFAVIDEIAYFRAGQS